MWKHIEDKEIRFDTEKNALLQAERGITFDTIVLLLEEKSEAIVDIKPHTNLAKYPRQHIIICTINNYVHMVPCVIEDDHVFLKTIFKSRKGTADYLHT
jgi:uncharacterized DUF497 family protein